MGYWNPRPFASPSIITSMKALFTMSISFLAVLVAEILLFAAHNGGQLGQIPGTTQSSVMLEKGAGCPSGWGCSPVNKRLHALFHLPIRQVVGLHKGGKVGVEGRKCLRARPLVLHDAQKVHHLVAQVARCFAGALVILPGMPPSPSWMSCFKLHPRSSRSASRDRGCEGRHCGGPRRSPRRTPR